MNQVLRSLVFGNLVLVDELPEYPAYSADLALPGYGPGSITLASVLDDAPDWPSFLRFSEESFPVLLQHEQSIRQQAAGLILVIHGSYYPEEWQGTATELVASLTLQHVNFFSDGTFELWYSGGDPFHGYDVRIGLDIEMRVREAGLDG